MNQTVSGTYNCPHCDVEIAATMDNLHEGVNTHLICMGCGKEFIITAVHIDLTIEVDLVIR